MTISESSFNPEIRSGLPSLRTGNRVFIVHADYDQDLAQKLKDLLISWGFDAFFGRQELRQLMGADLYRQEISAFLRRADLVVLILSSAFRHSLHCQAEAGAAAMVENIRQIPILVEPVNYGNYAQVSPMIDPRRIIDGRANFTVKLRDVLRDELTDIGMPETRDRAQADECQVAAEAALSELIDSYRTVPPSAVLTGTWPGGLTDQEANASIIAHIHRAIAEGETNVAVAGVSLKFSINIITEAINSLPLSHDGDGPRLRGPLNIELTHVDDQAHVLYAIEDPVDIGRVVEYFRIGWAHTKETWKLAGSRAGVTVNIAEPAAIDYIPQQVGIRVQSVGGRWSVLYAGHCAFVKAGFGKIGPTTLRVGEGEYAFYTASLPNPYSSNLDTRGAKMIDVFNEYVRHYSDPAHNDGVTVVANHIEWIHRLEKCLWQYEGIHDLLLFSNTNTKLLALVQPALRRGCHVRVYATNPELLTDEEAFYVRSLTKRLTIDGAPQKQSDVRRGELYYVRQRPTFRAALIGDAVLGLEPYVPPAIHEAGPGNAPDAAPGAKSLFPSGLKLIITKYSAHFERLRAMVVEQSIGAEPAP